MRAPVNQVRRRRQWAEFSSATGEETRRDRPEPCRSNSRTMSAKVRCSWTSIASRSGATFAKAFMKAWDRATRCWRSLAPTGSTARTPPEGVGWTIPPISCGRKSRRRSSGTSRSRRCCCRGALPALERLPDDLKDLVFRNGFELSHRRWRSDVRELVQRPGLASPSASGAQAKTMRIEIFDEAEIEFRLILRPQAAQHARQKLVRRVLGGFAPGVFERVALAADRATDRLLAAGCGRNLDGRLAAFAQKIGRDSSKPILTPPEWRVFKYVFIRDLSSHCGGDRNAEFYEIHKNHRQEAPRTARG